MGARREHPIEWPTLINKKCQSELCTFVLNKLMYFIHILSTVTADHGQVSLVRVKIIFNTAYRLPINLFINYIIKATYNLSTSFLNFIMALDGLCELLSDSLFWCAQK